MQKLKSVSVELSLAGFLIAILLGLVYFFNWRVGLFASVFAVAWLFVSLILLVRPPGIPEIMQDKLFSDEQFVKRKDVIPVFPLQVRLRIGLAAACAACLLIWVSLVFMREG